MSSHYLFVFNAPAGDKILTCNSLIPTVSEATKLAGLFSVAGEVTRGGEGDRWAIAEDGGAWPGCEWVSRRDVALLYDYDTFTRSGAAFQMMSLYANNRFCGSCGADMEDSGKERARVCPVCGRLVFPVLAPAVIMSVEKEGRLLMGHGINFPAGRYSVLAGFVEPGETAEEAVAREVFEESGIRVANIRYFGSQPWPFPASMMLGFQADWQSGEPIPDGGEVTDVRWFSPDDLPVMPPSVSISRRLIEDWYLRMTGGQTLT